ncbi:hypothetical protein Pelo_2474 [Pelomyxa schiedti]|nr:hypothetical protein Pelo_2474 [Pelomyxa schiedti]
MDLIRGTLNATYTKYKEPFTCQDLVLIVRNAQGDGDQISRRAVHECLCEMVKEGTLSTFTLPIPAVCLEAVKSKSWMILIEWGASLPPPPPPLSPLPPISPPLVLKASTSDTTSCLSCVAVTESPKGSSSATSSNSQQYMQTAATAPSRTPSVTSTVKPSSKHGFVTPWAKSSPMAAASMTTTKTCSKSPAVVSTRTNFAPTVSTGQNRLHKQAFVVPYKKSKPLTMEEEIEQRKSKILHLQQQIQELKSHKTEAQDKQLFAKTKQWYSWCEEVLEAVRTHPLAANCETGTPFTIPDMLDSLHLTPSSVHYHPDTEAFDPTPHTKL